MRLFGGYVNTSLPPTQMLPPLLPQGGANWIGYMSVRPFVTGLLSLVTITVRWNDGQSSQSHVDVVPLASLAVYKGAIFQIDQADFTNVTIEIARVGTGECWAVLDVAQL